MRQQTELLVSASVWLLFPGP